MQYSYLLKILNKYQFSSHATDFSLSCIETHTTASTDPHLNCKNHSKLNAITKTIRFTSRYGLEQVVKEQTSYLMVSDQRRPWTPATPEESQVRCRPFKKEYALFLKHGLKLVEFLVKQIPIQILDHLIFQTLTKLFLYTHYFYFYHNNKTTKFCARLLSHDQLLAVKRPRYRKARIFELYKRVLMKFCCFVIVIKIKLMSIQKSFFGKVVCNHEYNHGSGMILFKVKVKILKSKFKYSSQGFKFEIKIFKVEVMISWLSPNFHRIKSRKSKYSKTEVNILWRSPNIQGQSQDFKFKVKIFKAEVKILWCSQNIQSQYNITKIKLAVNKGQHFEAQSQYFKVKVNISKSKVMLHQKTTPAPPIHATTLKYLTPKMAGNALVTLLCFVCLWAAIAYHQVVRLLVYRLIP
uniref:SFRICE_007462 n=1 Tax=Spodoptera frugiperda TaxID=7108 RepID=A0A2H1VXI2_SPOFR